MSPSLLLLFSVTLKPDSDSDDDDVGPMEVEEEEMNQTGDSHLAQVSVPSQKEVEEMLIRRKKKVTPI